jgi:hypothetical protein
MTRNPLINALAAAVYVSLVALAIESVPPKVPALAAVGPLLFLSAFVFSAALMAYIVLLQPLLSILEGKTKEGVALFLKTLGCFALVMACVVGVYAALL